MNIINKLFGTHSERELKLIAPTIDKIEALRPTMQALTDEELKERQKNTSRDWQQERLWMIFFQRHLQLSERQQSVYLVWSITGYS